MIIFGEQNLMSIRKTNFFLWLSSLGLPELEKSEFQLSIFKSLFNTSPGKADQMLEVL